MKYIILTSCVLFIFSCKKDPEVVTPKPIPKTTVSFSSEIMPIIQTANCNGPYCHGGGNVPGIKFDDYTQINAIPTSRLIGAINHNSGYDTMPRLAEKLAQSDIDLIETWISEGKKDN